MNRATKLYAWSISALGLAAGIWSCVIFFAESGSYPTGQTVFLFIFIIICRSFPLKINEDRTLELSFIGVITVIMLRGAPTAAAAYLLTLPFIFEPAAGGEFTHIFNRSLMLTGFKNGCHIFTILAGGLTYRLFGGRASGLYFSDCIVALLAMSFVLLAVHALITSLYKHFSSGAPEFKVLKSDFLSLVASGLCAIPLGYFIALLIDRGSVYAAAIFIIPMILARYEFKLYLNSKDVAVEIVDTLTSAINVKDRYTDGHSKRVSIISELIARELQLSHKRINTIKVAATLHDIGKIGIDDQILNKPGALTDDEMAAVREHPEMSVKVIKHISCFGDIQSIILSHHERYDGTGYPNHLKDGQIPLDAAIVSVADAFDAMTSDRPYRKGFSCEKAVEIIMSERGRQFEPRAADALVNLYTSGQLTGKAC